MDTIEDIRKLHKSGVSDSVKEKYIKEKTLVFQRVFIIGGGSKRSYFCRESSLRANNSMGGNLNQKAIHGMQALCRQMGRTFCYINKRDDNIYVPHLQAEYGSKCGK